MVEIQYDAVVGVSWMVNDLENDAVPRDSVKRIAEMKCRAQGFAEPLLSMIMDIPDDSLASTGLRLADFPTIPWDNCNGLVTMHTRWPCIVGKEQTMES